MKENTWVVYAHWAHDEPETSDEISIGHMHQHGDRVPQDYATALHWYQLAAATRTQLRRRACNELSNSSIRLTNAASRANASRCSK